MLDNADLIPANDFRSLVKYDVTPEQIEAKKAAYAALEATTPKGYEEVRKARADVRGLRVAIEDRRKELKKVPLEIGRYIDEQAKQYTALILSIEEPLSLKLKAVDDEKDRLRREKEAAEKAAIEAEIKAKREAEEARLKALRDAEEEKNRIEAERLAKVEAELAAKQKSQDDAEKLNRMRMSEIQGIQQQVIIAQSGRAGVRMGGTIKCIEDTLTETEGWSVTEDKFGNLAAVAQSTKEAAVASIKALLADAKSKAADAAKLKADEARLAAEREKVEAEQKAERDRLAAEQRKLDEDRRRVQAEKEAADRAEFERQARIKAEADAKAQAERDAREAEERRVAEEAQKAAEAKRREEMRPDVEKVAAFADLIATVVPPAVTSDECVTAVNFAMKRLAHTARELRDFAGKARTTS